MSPLIHNLVYSRSTSKLFVMLLYHATSLRSPRTLRPMTMSTSQDHFVPAIKTYVKSWARAFVLYSPSWDCLHETKQENVNVSIVQLIFTTTIIIVFSIVLKTWLKNQSIILLFFFNYLRSL